MARPRTPIAKAKLTGAAAKNPQRYRDRAGPALSGRPVGGPPEYLKTDAAASWRLFADELPWLIHEDRAALEAASLARAALQAAARKDEAVSAAFIGAYRGMLSALGATPTDRSKIPAVTDDEDDPFAIFDNPRAS